jgi:hypothetical protein
MKNPYKEDKISENKFIREFSGETNQSEYIWHIDREDRIIESVDKTDWYIQLDNQLPRVIEGEIFIPRGVYHRIIKGSGNLRIKLTKLNKGD